MAEAVDPSRILIVDDDQRVLDFVRSALAEEGLAVETADSGEKALHLFREQDFALVIVDLRLPGIDGLDLLANIQKQDESVVTMVLSGSGTIEAAVEAMKRGALDYLSKPISVDVLLRSVHKALSHSRLMRDNVRLQRIVERQGAGGPVVAESAEMKRTVELARRVAHAPSPVLISGETGSGKGFIARLIHESGPRAAKPLIHVNCGSLPEQLVESELFGHEEGAFTGAARPKPGLFEVAHQGTLFLDEIGELPLPSQAKLLQVLDDGETRRVGGHKVRRVDSRVLAASNKDLDAEVQSGRFREDLLFRLRVLELALPPLRERTDDVDPLIDHYLERFKRSGSEARVLTASARALLRQYPWPGNVRELANVIERACWLSAGGQIEASDLALAPGGAESTTQDDPEASMALREVERQHVAKVLRSTGGNRAQAARRLGIDAKTLRKKIRDYGLDSTPAKTRS